MRKIFISGSISSKEVPQEVIKSVDDSRKRNYTILIGDAKGIDKNIQDMLKADNYKNVEVYHVGPSPRNLSDREWIDRRIPVDTENEKFFKIYGLRAFAGTTCLCGLYAKSKSANFA